MATKKKTAKKPAKQKPSPRSGVALPAGNHPQNTGGKKGRSGRKPNKVKVLCREAVDDYDLIAELAKIASDTEEKTSDRISAITKLLEYGYGKPTQPLEVDTDQPLVFSINLNGAPSTN